MRRFMAEPFGWLVRKSKLLILYLNTLSEIEQEQLIEIKFKHDFG